MEELPQAFQTIQDCEAAIGRIRAIIRSESDDQESISTDWDFIFTVVQLRFAGYARQLRRFGQQAVDEAIESMNDRLFDNIWSLTFLSLETGFGNYLHHMPQRILQETARKYAPGGVSHLIEHLDETVGEDGLQRHELIPDLEATAEIERLAERRDIAEAIERLPALEREVIMLRLQDVDNNTIASRFDISAATATRIWKRGVELLKQDLRPTEE